MHGWIHCHFSVMQCDPSLDWSEKYSPEKGYPLSKKDVSSCGRQILEVRSNAASNILLLAFLWEADTGGKIQCCIKHLIVSLPVGGRYWR